MGASPGFEQDSGLAFLNVKIENKKAPAIQLYLLQYKLKQMITVRFLVN